MQKIKILASAECSSAKSGFGKYYRNILERLSQDDQFEISELASFCCIEEAHKYAHVKNWKFYPASVSPNHPQWEEFNSNPANHFGQWRFDRCLLHVKPHHVFSIRDMYNDPPYIISSPFRKFFHFSYMSTHDSIPLRPQWYEFYKEADAIFSYSDWAAEDMKRVNGSNYIGSAYPGTNLDVFKPLDKIKCRQELGLPEDAYIVGFVARNQIRKWFPEFFKVLRIFLDKYGNTDIGKKIYFYVHTSYPDVSGWQLDDLLNEYGVTNRVFFSYFCGATGNARAVKFSGIKAHSFWSGQPTLQCPNTVAGFSEEQLAKMYNCFDLYVQYVTNEGSGMPHLENSACGVPSAGTYYSATGDVIDKTAGIKLEPASLPRDFNLMADRSTPNNEDTANAIYKFLSLDKKYKEKKGKQARQAAEKYFNWDTTAKIWADYFKSAKLTGLQGRWDAPIQIADTNIPTLEQCPPNLNNLQFMHWCASAVARDPSIMFKYTGLDLLYRLNIGNWPQQNFDRPLIYNIFRNIGQNKIQAELARCGHVQLDYPDWLELGDQLYKGQLC